MKKQIRFITEPTAFEAFVNSPDVEILQMDLKACEHSFAAQHGFMAVIYFQSKPVPSEQENLANYVDLKEEQENQEPMVLEVIGNFLHSSGLVFDTNDADHVASDFIEYLKSEGLTITRK